MEKSSDFEVSEAEVWKKYGKKLGDHYKLDPVEVHTALRRMRFFGRLSDEQLHQVVKSFQMASFSEGEYAVEQGELGDAFYIITRGEAAVMRTQHPGSAPFQIGTLSAWQCFGERSLLTAEPRNAGILATSEGGMECLAMTRTTFERVIGPMRNFFAPEDHRRE